MVLRRAWVLLGIITAVRANIVPTAIYVKLVGLCYVVIGLLWQLWHRSMHVGYHILNELTLRVHSDGLVISTCWQLIDLCPGHSSVL